MTQATVPITMPRDAVVSARCETQLNGTKLKVSMAQLLASLVVLLIVSPLLDEMQIGRVVDVVLLTLVFVSAVVAVSDRLRTFIIAMSLVVPAFAASWYEHIHPNLAHVAIVKLLSLLFLGYVLGHLVRFVITRRVDLNVLCAAVSAYLTFGILCAIFYRLLSALNPAAFNFIGPAAAGGMTPFSALYFSFTTLSTVGYGDITPVSNMARTAAMFEATAGMFYVTLLVSRLVAMFSTLPPTDTHSAT